MNFFDERSDVPLCQTCACSGFAECDWLVSMQYVNDKSGEVKVGHSCFKKWAVEMLMDSREMSRVAANTARATGDEAKKHVEGVGRLVAALVDRQPIEVTLEEAPVQVLEESGEIG